jgi:integrase
MMASAKQQRLTQAVVEGLKCPPGQKDTLVFDAEVKGFAVRVTEGGSKTFVAQYTVGTAKRRVPIGRFGTVTVAEARRSAKTVLGQAAAGADPFAERKAAAVAAQAAKAAAAYTFGHMVQQWGEARKADRRESYLVEAVRCIERNLPQWQGRPAASITFAEAVAALDAVKASKSVVAANRTQAYASAAFGWAVRRQRIVANPLRGVEKAGREEPRERTLSGEELADIWAACDHLSPTLAGFVRTLMLTLQRREEVASMRWDELDNPADPTVWTLPSARAKNRRSHVVHLSAPVRAIVQSTMQVQDNPHVFASMNGSPIRAFSYVKAEIDKAVPHIPPWRFHDFRRSGVTALAGLDFPPHVCDRLLNHVGGTISGVAAVYQRHEFLKERQAALDAWAGFILVAVEVRQQHRPPLVPGS